MVRFGDLVVVDIGTVSKKMAVKRFRISIALKNFFTLFQIRQSYDPRSKLTPSVTFSSTCRSNDEAILGGCSERWKSQIEQTSN